MREHLRRNFVTIFMTLMQMLRENKNYMGTKTNFHGFVFVAHRTVLNKNTQSIGINPKKVDRAFLRTNRTET